MKVSVSKIGFILYMFFFLFTPPFIKNVNFIYIVAGYAYLMLILKYRGIVKSYLKEKRLLSFNLCILSLAVYTTIIYVINSSFDYRVKFENYYTIVYRLLYVLLLIEPICLYVVCSANKKGWGIKEIIESLIYSTSIQGVLCLITVAFPKIKQVFTDIIINNTGYYNNVKEWARYDRFFGFSSAMTDSFGYLVGIVCGLCLMYAYYYQRKFYMYIPLMMIAIILNSITGVVIFGMACILLLIDKKISNKKMVFIILGIIAGLICVGILFKVAPYGMRRVMDNLFSVINSDEVTAPRTTMEVLTSKDFWTLPDSVWKILMGVGNSILVYGSFGVNSDIGFVNDIWSFGLIASIIFQYIPFTRLCKATNSGIVLSKKLIAFLIISFAAFNIKGVSFGANPGIAVTILIILSLGFCKMNLVNNNEESLSNKLQNVSG